MKKVGKIKLNQFGQEELDRRKLNALKGGCGCTSGSCGSCGGSSDWTEIKLTTINLFLF